MGHGSKAICSSCPQSPRVSQTPAEHQNHHPLALQSLRIQGLFQMFILSSILAQLVLPAREFFWYESVGILCWQIQLTRALQCPLVTRLWQPGSLLGTSAHLSPCCGDRNQKIHPGQNEINGKQLLTARLNLTPGRHSFWTEKIQCL